MSDTQPSLGGRNFVKHTLTGQLAKEKHLFYFVFYFCFSALDKLGMRSGAFGSPSGPNGTGPVEPALPNTVFDVASLALYGCHALPIRLKILLDRLFSVLPPEDVVQVLTGFGWSLEDYARGYILQVRKNISFLSFFSCCCCCCFQPKKTGTIMATHTQKTSQRACCVWWK